MTFLPYSSAPADKSGTADIRLHRDRRARQTPHRPESRCPRALRRSCPPAAKIPAAETRCVAWDEPCSKAESRGCYVRRSTQAEPKLRSAESIALPCRSMPDLQFGPPAFASAILRPTEKSLACRPPAAMPKPLAWPSGSLPATGLSGTDLQRCSAVSTQARRRARNWSTLSRRGGRASAEQSELLRPTCHKDDSPPPQPHRSQESATGRPHLCGARLAFPKAASQGEIHRVTSVLA